MAPYAPWLRCFDLHSQDTYDKLPLRPRVFKHEGHYTYAHCRGAAGGGILLSSDATGPPARERARGGPARRLTIPIGCGCRLPIGLPREPSEHVIELRGTPRRPRQQHAAPSSYADDGTAKTTRGRLWAQRLHVPLDAPQVERPGPFIGSHGAENVGRRHPRIRAQICLDLVALGLLPTCAA